VSDVILCQKKERKRFVALPPKKNFVVEERMMTHVCFTKHNDRSSVNLFLLVKRTQKNWELAKKLCRLMTLLPTTTVYLLIYVHRINHGLSNIILNVNLLLLLLVYTLLLVVHLYYII
jgi:hypothetical protein